MVHASTPADGWFDDQWPSNASRRLGQATALSLALHVGLLIAAFFLRLPQHGERPLASIEINLASLPTPPVKAAEPPKIVPKPVEAPKPAPAKTVPIPAPPVPVKTAPAPIPVPAPAPSARVLIPKSSATPLLAPVPPVKSSNDILRDVMKGVELPPDAPKFGDFSPTEKPKKTPLRLPDVPVASDLKAPASKPADVKLRSSLAEDLSKELDEELKKLKPVELPRPAPVESAAKPAPQQMEAKVPSVKAVETTLKVPGIAPGSNAYLARVRQRISSFWSAPPVDVTGQTYVVVVQFRLHRNGSVTGVAIERSSGNEYYDLAGKRAVISANPLPMFPAEITEPYFDAHFTFTVGESQG